MECSSYFEPEWQAIRYNHNITCKQNKTWNPFSWNHYLVISSISEFAAEEDEDGHWEPCPSRSPGAPDSPGSHVADNAVVIQQSDTATVRNLKFTKTEWPSLLISI